MSILNETALCKSKIRVKGRVCNRKGDTFAPAFYLRDNKSVSISNRNSPFIVEVSDGDYIVYNTSSAIGTFRDINGSFDDKILPGDTVKIRIRNGIIQYCESSCPDMPIRYYIRDGGEHLIHRGNAFVTIDSSVDADISKIMGYVRIYNCSSNSVTFNGILIPPYEYITLGERLDATSSPRKGSNKTINVLSPEDVKLPKKTTLIEKIHVVNNTSSSIKVIGYELGETLTYTLQAGKAVDAYIVPVFGFSYTTFHS